MNFMLACSGIKRHRIICVGRNPSLSEQETVILVDLELFRSVFLFRTAGKLDCKKEYMAAENASHDPWR